MTNTYKDPVSSITLDDSILGRDIAEVYTIGFVDGSIEEMHGSSVLMKDLKDTMAQNCIEGFKKTYGAGLGEKYAKEIMETFQARIEHHIIGAVH